MIADLSVNHVERQVLLCGHTVERVRHDHGYDLFMFTYGSDGQIENGDVRLQIKATDTLKTSSDAANVLFRLDRADLALWLDEIMPVILILYDAAAEFAYWLHVQAHFATQPFDLATAGATLTVSFPKSRLFDVGAAAEVARLHREVYRRLQSRRLRPGR